MWSIHYNCYIYLCEVIVICSFCVGVSLSDGVGSGSLLALSVTSLWRSRNRTERGVTDPSSSLAVVVDRWSSFFIKNDIKSFYVLWTHSPEIAGLYIWTSDRFT